MQQLKLELHNLIEEYRLDYVAKAANGSVLYQHGGSVLLATVCTQENDKYDDDFLPLSVQYIEKAYAGRKFPSGFVKREGKPSEFEILTSRLIDRTLRPLFPKGYRHITSIIVLVLSYDGESDLQLCALNAAANALYLSDLPLESLRESAVSGVRIGRKNGEFIINPRMGELEESELDLFVSGRGEELLMIEMKSIRTENGANELDEEELLNALELAKNTIAAHSRIYHQNLQPYKKMHFAFEAPADPKDESLWSVIDSEYKTQIEAALAQMAKSERHTQLKEIAYQIAQNEGIEDSTKLDWHIMAYKKSLVRSMILESRRRADGRGLKEVRPISIQTNFLPSVHGSVLFTRGQTQALVCATLGSENDAQSYESLGSKNALKDKFLFHYNFPGFSVGEASMIGSPGRRELGHGNLAKRALESSIKDNEQSIRLVSEILESNGSSSMASVCGGSLALCACGVEVDSLIAGVAMGLVSEGDKYAILTDISGLEDHDGDMDFKVAGGYRGISAMQMDIKLGGVSKEILSEALYQAKEAREQILGIMEAARTRIVLNDELLPKVESFFIPPHKIVEVIGQGGRVIREIIERFGVSVDLARETGRVSINAESKDSLLGAKTHILNIANSADSKGGARGVSVDWESYVPGERFVGRIKKIADFGVFIELPRGGDGLVHISKFTRDKNARLAQMLEGVESLECEIISQNRGKVELGLVVE